MERLAKKKTEKVRRLTAGAAGHEENHEAGKDRGLPQTNLHDHRNGKQDEMTAQQQYETAERLARQADRNGGTLPVTLLQQAAEAGYAPAIYALANWHIHGKGVKKNHRKGVGLLKRAAAKKFPAAEYDLGFAYETGKGGLAKDQRAAMQWYRRAAHHGDLGGQTEAARCYFYGIGTPRNLAKAVRWYAAAARRGDADSQYALGRAYEFGDGIERNLRSALAWYRKAAAQGDDAARQAVTDLEKRQGKNGRVPE